MGFIVSVTNQKGGVGKTTTAVQLGKGLQLFGNQKVLFVDMDPQCNMGYILGVNDGVNPNILDLLTGSMNTEDVISHCGDIDIIPSSQNLSAVEQYLIGDYREYRLRNALNRVREKYDFIVIDSPPTLGITTINILTASDYVVIPALADVMSLQGIGQLFNTIDAVREYCNPRLKVTGILLNRHVARLLHSKALTEMIEETSVMFGTEVYRTTIRESVAIREAASARRSIFEYKPGSDQAEDFRSFIAEFEEKIRN